MTIPIGSSGGGSPWLVPSLPEPITGFDYIPIGTDDIPHKGTLVDNINFPSNATGFINGKLNTATIWSVEPEDLDASNPPQWLANAYANWYDSINDRLYLFALDGTTTPDTIYLAYITLETGAVTQIGGTQLSTDLVSPTSAGQIGISRPNIDSGNFTLHGRNNIVVIDENTGAEISNVPAKGITNIGNYISQDTNLTLFSITCNTASSKMDFSNNRVSSGIGLPYAFIGGHTASMILNVFAWGDEVRVISSAGNRVFYRAFNRSDFDTWLAEIVLLGGV